MAERLPEQQQLTIEEFLAFTDERPDGEKWELIEGIAVLNASPTNFHQIIAGNILALLWLEQAKSSAAWLPLLGIGTRVPASPRSLPQPDVMVHETEPTEEASVSEDALVLFEVLSRSNSRSDQNWRKKAYASIPNCQHYVTVSQKLPLVARYDRANGWKHIMHEKLSDVLELPCLGVTLDLRDIYKRTPVAAATRT